MVGKRKMSPEQREAAIERLRIAREKRLKENPPEYKSIHPSVLARDEDDPFSFKNVKEYIKVQKETLRSEKSSLMRDRNLQRISDIEGYIRMLNSYLSDGIWASNYVGPEENRKVIWKCIAPAYNDDGSIKRVVNVYYEDIDAVWTKEMDYEYYSNNS